MTTNITLNGRETLREDRLSKLPDEIIHRIFSTLDAKDVVQTSILSKRWRYIWISVPVLNFYDSSFEHSSLFEHFVHHFLSHRDSSTNVSKLNLECHSEIDDVDLVDSIIDCVTDTPSIFTTIEILTIHAECVVMKLPQLSVCSSLTILKLCFISTETTTFDFPSLKHLYLCNCRFECGLENSLDLFQDCVNLEYLHFHNCHYFGGIDMFKISSPCLTYLNISGFRVDEKFDVDCVIELATPRLKYFKYFDSDLYYFSSEINLSFVEKIDIDVGWFIKDTDLLFRLIELFEIMQRAQFISLSTEVIKVSIFSLYQI